jgi:hypothetical protein
LNDGGDEDSAEQYIQLDTDGRPVIVHNIVKEVIPWETEEEALSMVSVGVQRFSKKKYKRIRPNNTSNSILMGDPWSVIT